MSEQLHYQIVLEGGPRSGEFHMLSVGCASVRFSRLPKGETFWLNGPNANSSALEYDEYRATTTVRDMAVVFKYAEPLSHANALWHSANHLAGPIGKKTVITGKFKLNKQPHAMQLLHKIFGLDEPETTLRERIDEHFGDTNPRME